MGEGQRITLILMSITFLSQLCWTQEEYDILNYYTSTYRRLCYDTCGQHGNDYYWCNTKDGWDYCSLWKNTDYKGNPCKDDHPCDQHGEVYYWCYTKSGERGYCGNVEPRSVLYRSSTYHSECKDECFFYLCSLYYWCNTDKGWDYCSPAPDVTYKNEPCRSDHYCSTHGYDYSWCWTDSGWDYCGTVDTCRNYGTNNRQKRQNNNNRIGICIWNDRSNRRRITLTAEINTRDIADGENLRYDIINIISKWRNNLLRNQPGTLIRTQNLRIDLQGLVNRNNLRYYNLQIQVNVPRQQGASTTVAQVLIPQNQEVPERYVRRAFTESFRERARVFMDVKDDNNPDSQNSELK